MNNILKYIGVFSFAIFSFYYTDKVLELAKANDIIMVNINQYAKEFDYKCNEGYINEEGIVLGISGLYVDINKSYSNMKGIGYREELLEYKENKCILNKDNNYDKYILASNPLKNSVSIIIDTYSYNYYKDFISIGINNNLNIGLLVNNNYFALEDEYSNLLYKGNSEDDLKQFLKNIKKLNSDYITYCVKTNEYDIINDCSKHKINSIKKSVYIEKDLLLNIKKSLNKGDIIFIKENQENLEEFNLMIKYIKAKGINIVDINELLS